MKKEELIKLKKTITQETNKRNRINELFTNELIQEFILLNDINLNPPETDKYLMLNELLKKFEITESNGILVCIGNYLLTGDIIYQETNWYEKKLEFDNKYIQYQKFKDIETNRIYKAYTDDYIQKCFEKDSYYRYYPTPSEYCHKLYNRYLVSELKEKYTILNPYNTIKNDNGFNEVRKDYFITSIEQGQTKAKQLILKKYPQMR